MILCLAITTNVGLVLAVIAVTARLTSVRVYPYAEQILVARKVGSNKKLYSIGFHVASESPT
jgi:hypothetical protein